MIRGKTSGDAVGYRIPDMRTMLQDFRTRYRRVLELGQHMPGHVQTTIAMERPLYI
jgi:hypothetical protein